MFAQSWRTRHGSATCAAIVLPSAGRTCCASATRKRRRHKEAMMNGYGGNILRVNLTTGKITKETTPPEMIRDFIGGRGFGAYLLYKEVPKGADPLGPDKSVLHSSPPL